MKYALNDDVDVGLLVKTPHHYKLSLASNFKDRLKDTAAKINHCKVSADLECDEATFYYPTTFHAHLQFNKMIGLHAQLMTERGNNLEAQIDVLAKLYRGVYGGGELIYDDKAKSVILSKYGLFWKAQKNFNIALELNQIGDKQTLDASFYHQANPNTTVGTTFSYDTQIRKIGVTTAVSHRVDEATSIKTRVNNHGEADIVLRGTLTPTLIAEFSAGCNLSGFFHGKTHDESYTGINLKFVL